MNLMETYLTGKKEVRIWVCNDKTLIFFFWPPFEKENQPIYRSAKGANEKKNDEILTNKTGTASTRNRIT